MDHHNRLVVIPPELAPRKDSYSLRPPSPPHIHVPALPDKEKIALPAHVGFDSAGPNSSKIRELTSVPNLKNDSLPEWKYESRRNAQQILPFLYLGSYSAAKDLVFLRDHEISLLLVVRDLKSAQARLMSGDKVAQELGIAYAALDVQSPMELIASFPRFISIINEHLLAFHRWRAGVNGVASHSMQGPVTGYHGGKVLVFCESGNERSACCVVAYVIAMYGLDVVRAVQFTQARRLCISLSDDLKMLLKNFEDILRAQRDVRIAPHRALGGHLGGPTISASGSGQRLKRDAREMDFGEEMNEENYMDQERFLGRMDFVPFSDTADV